MAHSSPESDAPGTSGRPRTAPAAPRFLLWILLGTAAFLLVRPFVGGDPGADIAYSTFRAQLDDGNVVRVEVKGPEIRGLLQTPITVRTDGDSTSATRFRTYLPSFGDPELMGDLAAVDVEIRTLPEEDGTGWLWVWLLLPVLLLFMMWRARSLRSGPARLFRIGESGAARYDRDAHPETRFDDLAGMEGPKRELQEITEYLRDPSRFERLGGTMPTGVLLVGPPGTGKTMLARAVAGEAGVPFFSITGSDFMEMFVGVGAKRVRDLFEKAREAAPSIVFIDELDSIGRRRGAGLGGGHDEREQTLNQLLSELDGFEPSENVLVMAATNRPDILDPALLRPGRFDRRVTVHRPPAEAREEILRIHARGKPLHLDVDLGEVARATPGLSGADLENLLNEAALLAARRGAERIEPVDLEAARDKVIMGLERRGLTLDDRERELLAYHEAGHALVAALLPHTDPIHKVSIVPRGRAMGITQQLPEKDRYIYDREYMLDRLAVMMGGRAAEELALGTATSGAQDDLRQATSTARKMVLDWGMSDALGRTAPGGTSRQVFLGEELGRRREYSDETAREVDEAVRALVDSAYRRAREALEDHRSVLDRVAALLLEREEVGESEVREALDAQG